MRFIARFEVQCLLDVPFLNKCELYFKLFRLIAGNISWHLCWMGRRKIPKKYMVLNWELLFATRNVRDCWTRNKNGLPDAVFKKP